MVKGSFQVLNSKILPYFGLVMPVPTIRYFLLLNAVLVSLTSWSQFDWQWTPLPAMPEPVSNQGVTGWYDDDGAFALSFGGIDTTKLFSGIHLRSYRYDVPSGTWSALPDLPDTLGKIASAASTVGDTAYIFGGYHVFDGPPFELSSDRVHRLDIQSGTFLPDGAPIPTPIDDQVQAVWRDSLIFLITGWSDVGNVPDVQIYDPIHDSWQIGTSVPGNIVYEAFGASGVIIGDTIYYNGGAFEPNFFATGRLRIGVIDPTDPTQISWSNNGFNPGDFGYRMAALTVDDVAFWFGGSGNTYNYDGIAYDGSGGVEPLARILSYNPMQDTWNEGLGQDYAVMDLRGAAQVGPSSFIICGGMSSGQEVSDRTFQLDYLGPVSVPERPRQGFTLLQQPVQLSTGLVIQNQMPEPLSMGIFDLNGRTITTFLLGLGRQTVDISGLGIASGNYLLSRLDHPMVSSQQLIVVD